jgi:hypothetical protein
MICTFPSSIYIPFLTYLAFSFVPSRQVDSILQCLLFAKNGDDLRAKGRDLFKIRRNISARFYLMNSYESIVRRESEFRREIGGFWTKKKDPPTLLFEALLSKINRQKQAKIA